MHPQPLWICSCWASLRDVCRAILPCDLLCVHPSPSAGSLRDLGRPRSTLYLSPVDVCMRAQLFELSDSL